MAQFPIDIVLDPTDADKGISRIESKLDGLGGSASKAASGIGSAFAKTGATFDRVDKSVQGLSNDLGIKLLESIRRLDSMLGRMGQTSTAAARDIKRLESATTSANSAAGALVRNIKSLLAAYISMQTVKEVVSSHVEFEVSLREIATQIKLTEGEMAGLVRSAENMAVTFGKMPIEQTRGYYEIISAGIEDVGRATEVLTSANELAAAGSADLGMSVKGLTSVANAYGDRIGTMQSVTDSLMVAMKSGTASVDDFAGGLGRVSNLAATSGVSFDELVGSISALTATGIEASEAITMIRSLIQSINSPATQSAEAARELGLELSATALQGSGLTKFLDDLREKTGGSVGELNKLFQNVNAVNAAVALTNNAGNIYVRIMDEMTRKTGQTREALEEMNLSDQAKIDSFFAAAAVAGNRLGAVITETLIPALTTVTGWLNNMTGAADKMPTPLEKAEQKVQDLKNELRELEWVLNIPVIGDLLFNRRKYLDTQGALDGAVDDLNKLKTELQEVGNVATGTLLPGIKPIPPAIKSIGDSTKKTVSESKKFLDSLKREAEQAGKTSMEILRLQAVKLGIADAAEVYIQRLEEEIEIEERGAAGKAAWISDQERVKAIYQQIQTPMQKYNEALAEADDLLRRNLLSGEEHKLYVQQLAEAYEKVTQQTETQVQKMDQFMIRALRNIQTAFADYLFDPFDKGLKGMVVGVANVVRRMMAEFASMKILQSIGITGLFTSGNAMAGTSGGMSMFDMASMASSFGNLIKGGFGTASALSSGISSVGSLFGSSSMSAFGAGLAGNIGPVASGATYGSMLGSAGTVGSALAPVAGMLGAGAMGVGVGSLLAGDKEVFGLSGTMTSLGGAGIGAILGGPIGALAGGVIGGAVNALFGRGAMKQRDTVLSGTIGDEGFNQGSLQTNFRAKGGLFRSNKNDFARIDAMTGLVTTDNNKLNEFADNLSQVADEIFKMFNESAKGVSGSLRMVADNLQLGTDGLNAFSREIRIASENGEFLTDTQIAEEIAAIGEAMTLSLMPNVREFSRSGETVVETILRLNTEFVVLNQAALILGRSIEETRAIIHSASFEYRTAFIEAAGGMDALSEKAMFFMENFMSDEQRLQPKIELLNEELGKLGLSADLTKDQFRDLVQSFNQVGGISEEMLLSLLNLQFLFIDVKNGLESLAPELQNIVNSTYGLAEAEQRLADKRGELIQAYQRERAELEATVNRLVTTSRSLREARDGFMLSDLSYLTPEQRLNEARSQFERDRILAEGGDVEAMMRLPESARNFLEASKVFNASSAEFIHDFNYVMEILERNAVIADTEAEYARQQIIKLDQTVSRLVDINRNVATVAELIKELNKIVLNGLGNPGITDQDILNFLSQPGLTNQNVIDAMTKYNVSGKQFEGATGISQDVLHRESGGMFVTDQQIAEFAHANINNPMHIYNTAKEYGVSLQRLADASGISIQDIDAFLKANNLAAFEKGTDYVPRTGLALLHKGEAVTPAKGMESLQAELKDVKKSLAEMTTRLERAIVGSARENANTINKGREEVESSRNWNKQAEPKLI